MCRGRPWVQTQSRAPFTKLHSFLIAKVHSFNTYMGHLLPPGLAWGPGSNVTRTQQTEKRNTFFERNAGKCRKEHMGK